MSLYQLGVDAANRAWATGFVVDFPAELDGQPYENVRQHLGWSRLDFARSIEMARRYGVITVGAGPDEAIRITERGHALREREARRTEGRRSKGREVG